MQSMSQIIVVEVGHAFNKEDLYGSNAFFYHRNLRSVVSVGVLTECARLGFGGLHAQDKCGCEQIWAHFVSCIPLDIFHKLARIISFGYISQIAHRTKMAIIKFELILAAVFPLYIFHKLARIYQYQLYYFLQIYSTNWQEITVDMLIRGDAFQVLIQLRLVSLKAPGNHLNYVAVLGLVKKEGFVTNLSGLYVQ